MWREEIRRRHRAAGAEGHLGSGRGSADIRMEWVRGWGVMGGQRKGPMHLTVAALATRCMTVSSEGTQVAGEEDELELLES